MNPLLTPPGIEPAPLATRARPAWPPLGVLALQALLLAEAAAVVAVWLWSWRGVQAYAWPGVDNGLAERGISYLLVLAPSVPVNVLAAIWLGRGGRRARLYLAAAGSLALVQVVVLLTPAAMPVREAMTDGAANVGILLLTATAPILFAGAVLAVTARARAWLGAEPARPRSRIAGVETAVWSLALLLAVAAGTEVRQWALAAAEPGEPRGEYTETGTWQRLEDAVGETTGALPAFSGFAARTVDVAACGYRTPAGLATYRYTVTYELRTADFPSYEEAIGARWDEGDYALTYDGATFEGVRRITAERADEIALGYTGGEAPFLTVASGCVERTDAEPACVPAQGEPTTDRVLGIACRDLQPRVVRAARGRSGRNPLREVLADEVALAARLDPARRGHVLDLARPAAGHATGLHDQADDPRDPVPEVEAVLGERLHVPVHAPALERHRVVPVHVEAVGLPLPAQRLRVRLAHQRVAPQRLGEHVADLDPHVVGVVDPLMAARQLVPGPGREAREVGQRRDRRGRGGLHRGVHLGLGRAGRFGFGHRASCEQ
ncbi:hypothetical protein SAMN05216298_3836 [Glycomyces sambucus]|uniref:Uncharacterized protein n=1 Tax=Glycomyces sambucus TaxID=380244 RepID=A0A1G9JTZ5_9ACTN|nr:hypothetical protein [Glycomyces sambucus]SDL40363.1 hypothetical protein SAMN05216298_3836 [Glycomyces sambucus]